MCLAQTASAASVERDNSEQTVAVREYFWIALWYNVSRAAAKRRTHTNARYRIKSVVYVHVCVRNQTCTVMYIKNRREYPAVHVQWNSEGTQRAFCELYTRIPDERGPSFGAPAPLPCCYRASPEKSSSIFPCRAWRWSNACQREVIKHGPAAFIWLCGYSSISADQESWLSTATDLCIVYATE